MSPIAPLIVTRDLEQTSALHPVTLESRQFDESWLQELLFAHPELLQANEIDPSFSKLVPLTREFQTTAGPIDILYATPDGLICLVETKLWRNPEAHRTVLAQILDYARHLTSLDYSDFKVKAEAAASRDGHPKDLLKIASARSPKADFDSIAFEEGIRRSLATGSFLLLIVGDRIRPEVAMLSEIIGTAPNLEFTLGLVEIAFYHLEKTGTWPILAVPSVVGRTHEVTRAVVLIRYEQKQPDVEVTAFEESTDDDQSRTDLEGFLASLPKGFDEVFRAYLERWSAGPYIVYWGKAGFSLRWNRDDRPLTIIRGFPTFIGLFTEKSLVDWGNPVEAYRAYRGQVDTVREVQHVYSQNRTYAPYNRMNPDDLRVILEATDQLARALVAHPTSGK